MDNHFDRPKDPGKLKRAFRITLRLAITVVLLWLVVQQLDIGTAVQVLASAKIALVSMMFLSMLAERFYATYRWYVLLRCGAAPVGYWQLLRVNFASGFLGAFLPTAGMDVLRVIGHSRKSDDPAMAFSSVFLDRYLGVLALVITALVGLAIEPIAVGRSVAWLAWPLVGLLALGFLFVANTHCRNILDWFLSLRWLASAHGKFHKVMRCLDSMRNAHWVMVWSLILAFGIQMVRILSVYLGARALGIETPFIYLAVTVPIIIFIQLMPIAVGGFGPREAAFVYFLGAAGVASESAFALSLLVYVVTTLSNLPGAWLSFSAFARAPSNFQTEKSVANSPCL